MYSEYIAWQRVYKKKLYYEEVTILFEIDSIWRAAINQEKNRIFRIESGQTAAIGSEDANAQWFNEAVDGVA